MLAFRNNARGKAMKKQPRWLKSVIAAAADVTTPMPYARGNRRSLAVRAAAPAKPRAIAAR
jgi:hypothetical protein